MSEQQLTDYMGTFNLKSNQELANAYAKINGIDLSNTEWKDNKYINKENNETIIDASNGEIRGQIRHSLFQGAAQTYFADVYQDQAESSTNDVIDILDNAIITATQKGQQYGVDFSSGLLNAIQTGDFNFEDLYSRLNPDEIIDLENKTDAEVLQLMGLTEEQLSRVSDVTSSEFANGFRNSFANYSWDIDKAIAAEVGAKGEELEQLGLNKSKLEEYNEEITTYTKSLMKAAENSDILAESLELDADAATDVAFAMIKMNKAIDTLADSFKDWKDILKKSLVLLQKQDIMLTHSVIIRLFLKY